MVNLFIGIFSGRKQGNKILRRYKAIYQKKQTGLHLPGGFFLLEFLYGISGKLTQNQFAYLMGINLGTLRNWEQGIRKPQGPARVLLGIALHYPQILLEMMEGLKKKRGYSR